MSDAPANAIKELRLQVHALTVAARYMARNLAQQSGDPSAWTRDALVALITSWETAVKIEGAAGDPTGGIVPATLREIFDDS